MEGFVCVGMRFPTRLETSFRSKCVERTPPARRHRALRCCSGHVSADDARLYLKQYRDGQPDVDRLETLLNSGKVTPGEAKLLLASRLGDVSSVKDAVARGCDVNIADVEGSTACMRAASRGHSEVLEVLLATGKVDVHQENDWGYSLPIYVGSVKLSLPQQHQTMLALLSEYMEDPEAQAEKRWTQAPKRS